MLFDDTGLDKRHSQRSELVRRQYSGNAHAVIKGIEEMVRIIHIKPNG